jgi:hypothetical protein
MFSHRFVSASAIVALTLALPLANAGNALAASRDKVFFSSVSGQWKGPGEIVAGKYKGTKFTCNLTGETPDDKIGMSLDGSCRVGVFSQPMKAVVAQAGSGYKGKFLDGAAGKGLDIVSGSVRGNSVVMGINRQKLNGAMVARMASDNTMNITISVKVGETLVPVIGLTLQRDPDSIQVGAIK